MISRYYQQLSVINLFRGGSRRDVAQGAENTKASNVSTIDIRRSLTRHASGAGYDAVGIEDIGSIKKGYLINFRYFGT